MSFDLEPILGVSVLLGLFVWLIKWIRRTLVEIGGSTPQRSWSRNETTDDRLAKLFESSGAAAYIAAQSIAPGSAMPLPNAGRMTGVAVLIHCPMCGEPVTEVATPLPFSAECPGCHRRINARGDGPQRVSIVVAEQRKAP